MAGTDFGEERQEIIADFIVESEELTERLDNELVELEERSEDLALLNSIFRAFHTIKGTSSFLGFARMTDLTHKAENVLDKLRNQEFAVSREIMDVLLAALDGIKVLIQEIQQGRGMDGDYDPTPVMQRCIAIVQNQGKSAPASSAPTAPSASAPPSAPAASGASDLGDLDALLASAPVVDPIIVIPDGSAAAATTSSAPASSPPSGELSLDDILAAAPSVQPVITIPGDAPPPQPAPAASAPPQARAAPAKGDDDKKTAAADPHKGVAVEQTIRVDVERLDALMNLAGELVLGRNRLANVTRQLEGSGLKHDAIEELAGIVASISLVAGNLQMAVMKTRMLPIGKVFNRFPRMIRDLARDLNKNIELEIIGSETEVDKSIIEAIGDPLVHLVRNSADHGIETPEKRLAMGKSEVGRVVLSASHEGNNVVIRIADDGGGIDPKRLIAKALEKGLIDEAHAARISDKEARLLIFKPGFSTAAKITGVSGRGVGMDVVKTNIEGLGGTIEIESEVGRGSTMSLKLPLTLAIIQALMVKARSEIYAISLANVMETVRFPISRIQSVEGHEVIQLRDRVIPVVRLSEVLDCPEVRENNTSIGREKNVYIVVLGLAEQRIGLIVEQLLGQEEVVIKSLGEYLQAVPGIAGSTILGDGRVALIVDVASLVTLIYENARGMQRV